MDDERKGVQALVENIELRKNTEIKKARKGTSVDLRDGGHQNTETEDDAEFFECNPNSPQDQPSDDARSDKPTGGRDSNQVVQFEENEDALVVRWDALQDIDHYRILCGRTSIEEILDKSTQISEYVLKRDLYQWKTGEAITISVTAIGKNDFQIVICEEVQYIIGGDIVPHGVELEFNGSDSYKSLVLTWNRAMKDPMTYEVTVHNKTGKTESVLQKTHQTEDDSLSIVVDNLRHLTEYFCVVKCKYADGTDGKPVHSNTLKTEDLPEELYKVQRVWAYKDPLNRVRQIIVKWGKPQKQIKISHFEVYLICNQNEKTDVQKIQPEKPMEACFKCLKSNTEYTACVITVRKIGKNVKAMSDAVITDSANKKPGFNIEEQGKPIIKECTVEQMGDDLSGKFEWALPDLGIEKYNYKFINDGGLLKEGGQLKVALDVVGGQRRVNRVKLKPGKSYSFTVTCSYLDYDSGLQCEASVTKIIHTDIGKPSIEDVKWFGKEITFSWTAAKGATQHILKVFDKEDNLAIDPKTLKHPTTNLRMTDACNYGKTCKFVIEASCEKQNETAEKSVLIGGDKAVTELVAKQDVANPRRAIVVEWQPPKKPPQGYRLILYDLGKEKMSMKEDTTPIEASQKTHRFVELKTETHYCVRVCPIYNGNPSDGTLSNVIITGKRINHANEQESGFGKTEKIIHAVKAVSVDQTTIELSWSSVQMGENCKVTGYEVWIYQKGWFALRNTTILKKNVGPKTTSVEVDLTKGLKYEVKVSTLHFDLDTAKKGETSKDYEIFTDPSKTTINDCGLGEGVVFFTWQSVNGAKKYQLVIKDEYFIKSLAPDFFRDVTEPGKGCSAKIQLSGELQIGRTCMTKVFVHAEGGGISETDWKAHLLGGDTVPRNVKVARSSENPKRAVNITFDCPKKGPAREYKILAFPESGMKKIVYSKTSNAVVEYLRKGITYHFEVYAKWETGWSKGSPSNSVRMEGDKGKSLMDIHNITGTNVDLTKAILAGQITEINVSLGKDFGQVEDLGTKPKRVRDKDAITLHWNRPSFDKKVSDFKVEMYKVEVWEQHASERWTEVVDFEKHRREYHSKEFELDLGETYKFAVSTIFLDIDQDYIFKSIAVQDQFHTRPCAPKCVRNEYTDDRLTIEWNAAKGAQRYQVELYADNDSEATFRQDMEKNTIYQRKFDENFGYGSTYYVVIKAFGVENISNFWKTSEQIIGGDRVATNVTVTSNHPKVADRNSEVFLSWFAPECAPKRYDISSVPAAETMKVNITGEECLVYGLKAGTEYYFKVKAVHEQKGKEKFSGGSTSKKIRTNPTPTQVKKVWADPGNNPSTSVEISWDKVDAEKENETVKYRVCLTKNDETTKREVTDVEAENVLLQDLVSGSTYFVTVAGGNSMGFGKDSEKVEFKTDLGTPKNLHLLNNKEILSTSLILEFSSAEGQVTKYLATLHKCQNQIYQPMSDLQEVISGHRFNDLEPNTEYMVNLRAVFASGEGKVVKSKTVMTAPSKTKIIDYGRTVENAQNSSREIYAEWSSDVGCNCHEVKVICGTSTVESRMFKEKNQNRLKYLCLNEATQYSIQVRSRNDSGHFGDWSDEALIHLAPAKLEEVSAGLDEDGYDILVQCRAALTHAPFYFMLAIRENEVVGAPIQAHAEKGVVKWKFTPPESAHRYSFELWAEDSGRLKGQSAFSNPVMSRPPKLKFTRVMRSLSTDIDMAWEKQKRCDSYEITICAHDQQMPENVVKTAKTSCWYRCKIPGNTYLISIRAIREHVKGDWSDDQLVTLAPAEIHLLEPSEVENEPVKTVMIKWKPLDITPEGYLVTLFCNGKEVEKITTKSTNHVFKNNLKPGSLCYCTVAAFNDTDCRILGKASKTRNHRIEWSKASNFTIIADENEPSRRAKMNWDKPPGVNCFKMEIENNQNGVVTTTCLTENRYAFESGIPGNTYTVRLHCGCDDRYDVNYIQQSLTMKPQPPTDVRVIANEQVKGLTIEFKDTPSVRKDYEIIAQGLTNHEDRIRKTTSHRSLTLRQLVPGESFKVSVSTIIGGSRSNEATSEGYIFTLPDMVKNIRSTMKNGSIHFEWDELDNKPSKYIVQWRVDNEPITEEQTQETTFMIFFLKPAHCYSARVMAANSSGSGPMSNWENYITDPSPPYGVNVYPDPEHPKTSLIVKFQDEKDSLKRYRITAEGPGEKTKVVTTHEHFAIVSGLKPGTSYMIKVQTLFCGKESDAAPFSRI